MKTIALFAASIAAPFLLTVAAPAAAQNYPLVPGDYVEISGIIIEDGGSYEYAKHIAGLWRKGQEFAKSKGWITDYEVLANVNPREGEPDIYLITSFASLPNGVEDERRQDEYRKMMKQSDAQLATASGDRAKFRKLGSSMLLREMKFR
jgi:hypothetical protein